MDVSANNATLTPSSTIEPDVSTTKIENRTDGVLVSSLQKFLELKKRREELTKFTQFKLSKIEAKRAYKASKKQDVVGADKKDSVKKSPEESWNDVRKYIDINAHLTGAVEHNVCRPKSGLEETINLAIQKKDFETAEMLSDQLATREFAVRINNAFGAKRYAEAEEIKKEITLRKRQKRIAWGFQTKQRWEMKGNM